MSHLHSFIEQWQGSHIAMMQCIQFRFSNNTSCVRGSPMVPLVGNMCIILYQLIANGTIGKEIGANGKNGNTIGKNVTNQ